MIKMNTEIPEEVRGLVETESYQLDLKIRELKVTNRESYEKACEVGIWNADVLKRIEGLRVTLLKPLKEQIKKMNEGFDKAMSIFEGNDEKIRKAMGSYQTKVDVEQIKTIHIEGLGRATVQERKDWEIEDETLIPKAYWKLDETAIGKIIRAGGTVPGIKVKTTYSTAFVAA